MSRSIFFQVVARLWLVFAVMAVGPPASAQISRAITDEVHPHGGANDLNGDGNFDISDMVHGLRFLFGGGLPPSALDLSRAPTVRSLEVRVRDLEQQILQLQANPGCRAGRTPHVGLESHFYKPIDLNRAVQEQFGPAATLTTVGEHLYDWRANVNGQLEHLDLALAVARHYGTDWTLVGQEFELASDDIVTQALERLSDAPFPLVREWWAGFGLRARGRDVRAARARAQAF